MTGQVLKRALEAPAEPFDRRELGLWALTQALPAEQQRRPTKAEVAEFAAWLEEMGDE